MFDDRRSGKFVLVLAAGSGNRLASLTTTTAGVRVPKQYCALFGGRSLLGDAIARAELLAARENIVVVVARDHARWWEREFEGSVVRVVVQPSDKGTAAGVLLGLRAIASVDERAHVTMLPADHFVADEGALAASLLAAQATGRADRPVLLGMSADSPDPEYGYVVPVRSTTPMLGVSQFVEKPTSSDASALLARGAVWNTMMLASPLSALHALYERRLPRMLAAFRWARPEEGPSRAASLYSTIETADFSRDVLQGSEPFLDLRVAAPCGWTDLGTPSRVRACVVRYRSRYVAASCLRPAAVDLAAAAEAQTASA
jgi:mannose-1-phosphate guanylyltransferase